MEYALEKMNESLNVQKAAFEHNATVLVEAAFLVADSLKKGGKLLLCGNGGSAADAQHIAAELVGRYLRERKALPAVALTVDTSILTAVSNDYGYENVFLRQAQALAVKGDVLLGISTSGNSANVIKAFEWARENGIPTIGMTGPGGGRMASTSDILLEVARGETPRVQEVHMVWGHVICDLVEGAMSE